tara:strand:- start:75686 stop:77659 length:1974 start_codon:yes stop_codon:yes gene_type:complete
MAAIAYNGQNLELPEAYSFNLVKSSGYFETDLKADFTLPLSLPYAQSEVNRNILRDLDIPQAITNTDAVDVFFEYAGRYFLSKMVFRGIDDDLTVNLYFDKTEFKSFNLLSNELSLVNTKDLVDLYEDGINESFPATHCFFPMIIAPAFYDDPDTDVEEKVNPNFKNILNAHEVASDSFYENYQDGSGENFNVNTLAPQVSLLAVLQAMFKLDGFRTSGSFFKNSSMRRAFVTCNRSLDQRVAPTIYEETKASKDFFSKTIRSRGDFQITYDSYRNAAINSNGEYLSDEVGEFDFIFECDNFQSNGYDEIQLIFLSGGVHTVVAKYRRDTAHSINGFKLEKRITISGAAGNLNRKYYIRYEAFSGSAQWSMQLYNYSFRVMKAGTPLFTFVTPPDLGPFLPKLKLVDFLNSVINTFCLKFSVDSENRTIYLDFRNNVYENPNRQDLTSFKSRIVPVDFLERKKYLIQYKAQDELERERLGTIYKSSLLVEEDGSVSFLNDETDNIEAEKINLGTFPLISQDFSQDPYPDGIRTLLFNQRGISLPIETEGENLERLRIGFFVGKVNNYPVAANSYEGYSLWIDSNDGSTGGAWSTWLSRYNRDNRLYKPKFLLPNKVLDNLKLSDPVVLEKLPYIIKSLNAEVTSSDEQVVELELKRM